MIRYVRGNLFESKAEALVNTVNCVGIMGKGIAYQFRRAYPAMFKDYERRCRLGEIKLGQVTDYIENGRRIINFPTKGHWKSASKLQDISEGLIALKDLLLRNHIRSVALPPLGCGNGGLSWPLVRQEVDRILGDIDEVLVEAYEPAGDFGANASKEPKLTLGHFVLAGLRLRLASDSKLSLQKAAYFFNIYSGTPYFQFTEYKHGPYSLAIDPMLQAIKDYLDYSKLPRESLVDDGITRKLAGPDADRLRAWISAIKAATELCNEAGKQIEAVATVHAILHRSGSLTEDDLIREFYAWSEQKQHFTLGAIRRAVSFLEQHHLMHNTLLGYELITPLQTLKRDTPSIV